VEKEFIYRT